MTLVWTVLLGAYAAIYRAFDTPPLTSLEGIVFFANGMLIYLFLFLTFCYCYFVSNHSLSVLYMMALEDVPEQCVTVNELKQKFPYDELLSQRLRDLEANHFVLRSGEHFELTSQGKGRAHVAGGLKKFLNLEPGG